MNYFYNNWESLLRVLVIGVLGYLGLILVLRISGNRTLSKMNSFDFIITVAIGSTFATALLQKSVSLADLLLAFIVLVGLQFLITFLTVRYDFIDQFVKSDPILIFADGKYLWKSMKRAHVTESEILAAIRKKGVFSIDEISYVVLETNGEITAIVKDKSSKQKENLRTSLSPDIRPKPEDIDELSL
ncbi:MAG: DUF421 domain-containing protein [Bacteriovoracia bacterium]